MRHIFSFRSVSKKSMAVPSRVAPSQPSLHAHGPMKSRLARIDPMQRISGAPSSRLFHASTRRLIRLAPISAFARRVLQPRSCRPLAAWRRCFTPWLPLEQAQSPFQRLFKLELHSPASCCNYDDAPRIGRMYKAHAVALRCQSSYRSLLGAPELDAQIHPPTNFLSRSAVRLTADTRLNQ